MHTTDRPRILHSPLKESTSHAEEAEPTASIGLLARLGAFCARHRWWIAVAWLGLFVVGTLVGGQVFVHLKESNGASSSESVHGLTLLDKASADGGSMVAIVDGPSVTDPAVRAAVNAAARQVAHLTGVTGVVTAYNNSDPRLRSPDGKASVMLISTAKTDMVGVNNEVASIRNTLADSVPGATVTVGGDLAVMHDQELTMSSDLVHGEAIALPILLVALLLVFRGVRAALIPVLGALVTVAGALLLLLGVTGFLDVSSYAVDVVALFGIALAVDYSLLIVNRFREERGAGHDVADAVARSIAAAGRTITFSALTVIASLSGLFAFRDPTFTSLAVGGIATTVIALLAGLLLVPALLGIWGRKIRPEVRAQATDGAFGRLARRVQRHPIIFALGAAAALIACGAPFLSAHYGQADPRVLPHSFESRAVADTLLTRFPGNQVDPIQIVAQRPATDSAVRAYADKIRSIPGVTSVAIGSPLPNSTVSVTDVMTRGATQSDTAAAVVTALRVDRPSYRTYVTGSEASLLDFKHSIAAGLPWALGLIALATFLLLFLMTGSVLVPIKALAMNVLSLGATFGALVWIFQDGHLSGLLGFDSFGAIEVWVPVVVFVFAFGLSMDYEVFLLSRIKECYDECGDSDSAVANGLQRSGRIITSAAGLVMIVFLGFALGQNLGIKEMGLALAVAVAVDATLVRCILVPATMTLLGAANWWAPTPLRRLHNRYGLTEAPSAVVSKPAPAVAATVPSTIKLNQKATTS
jgi:RND superfamily putative drug exporter